LGAQPARKTALTFGPYGSGTTALYHYSLFIDQSFPRDEAQGLGIVWMEPAGATVLRLPAIDQNTGIGASLLVQYHGPVPPRAPEPPKGFPWQSIEDAVRSVYERIGMGIHAASGVLTEADSALQQKLGPLGAMTVEDVTPIGTLLDLRTAWRFIEKELAAHPRAAAIASTVLDVIGVVGGVIGVIVLAPEIATVAGAAAIVGAATAGVASVFLTVADARDAYLLCKGDQAGVPADQTESYKWEHSDFFRRTELLAPLLALPDAARGGAGVAREIGEASEAAREAAAARALALTREDQIAAKVADQRAINEAKPIQYKGNRRRLQQLVISEKNAAKKLRHATKVLAAKEDALRKTILHAALQDGPGLFSTAAGTGIYIGHLPDMLQPEDKPVAPAPGGVVSLVPYQPLSAPRMTSYFSLSITATSPLQMGR
jgi:hypothetical protein